MPDLLDIVGQDAALAQLQRATGGDRRPHAWLFAGPEGVGRRTTAVELARLLLCERAASRPNLGRLRDLPKDFPLRQGCGACASCTALSAGTHPDLHLVRKELARYHDDPEVRGRKMQALGIEVIRQFLIDPAGRAAAAGRGKVFVVIEAGAMSPPAQNALLKTLEEPPAGVTLILICTRPGDLLPTTRSRCQVVRFGPLPADFVAGALAADGTDAGEARFWARLTEGSLGRSRRLAETDLYAFKRELLDALAALPGGGAGELAEKLLDAAKKQAKTLTAADGLLAESVATRRGGELLLGLVASAYRDALRLAAGAEGPLIHDDQRPAVEALAGRFAPTELADILRQLSRCEQLIWRNVNAKLLWDNVAITCASGVPLEV